jgi:hypothetical protein
LLCDGYSFSSTCLLSSRLLWSARFGDFGSFGFGWSSCCCAAAATDGRGLDVKVVALFERREAFLDRVDFGALLGGDLAGVDLVV